MIYEIVAIALPESSIFDHTPNGVFVRYKDKRGKIDI